MPKGILEFNLSEEKDEFELACKAIEQSIVLDNIRNKIRSYLKYDNDFKSADEALENLQDYFFEQIKDYNIPIS